MKRERLRLSNSTANLWTSCQRKYKYIIEEGLKPYIAAPPLSFGSLWHSLQEYYWTVIRDKKVGSNIENARQAHDHYWIHKLMNHYGMPYRYAAREYYQNGMNRMGLYC